MNRGAAAALPGRGGLVPDPALIVALLAGLGLVALAGAAVGRLGLMGVGAGALLGLILLGLRFPLLPFVVALLGYSFASANEVDNSLLRGADALYEGLAGPVSPADVLLVTAAISAFGAFMRMTPEARSRAWTPLAAPMLALVAAGALSGLIVHREGSGAVLELMPVLRLVVTFAVVSVLLAGGHLSRERIMVAAVVVAQPLALLGIYNALRGEGGETTITEISSTGTAPDEPVDERTIAFVDAASVFVLVIALTVILVRVLWGPASRRPALGLLAVLPVVAVVLSGRRAMWIDFTLAAAVVVVVSARIRKSVLAVALAATVLVGVGVMAVTSESPAYRDRLSSLPGVVAGSSQDFNIRSRQVENVQAWDNIREHPIAGIGLTQPYASRVQFTLQDPTYVHNNLLAVWLKFGALGLLAVLWLFWRVGRRGLPASARLKRSVRLTGTQSTLVATAVLIGFFGAIMTAAFLTDSTRFPVLVGVLLALVGSAAASYPLERRTRT